MYEDKMKFELNVNGKRRVVYAHPSMTLVEVLRQELNLTGTKQGCDDSNCGVCTVLLDGKAVKSCTMLVVQAVGHSITTIEGLETEKGLHPLQQSFIDHFAVQCGYCTPGMIMTAKSILDENPNATEDDIREGLHGNLCRCTGYENILRAVKKTMYKRLGKPMPEAE